MAENMVRCVRCHEVFDAEVGPCTKCGTPWEPPKAQTLPPVHDGLYVELYGPGDPTGALAPAVVRPPHRSLNVGLWLGAGFALIGAVLVVAILFEFGVIGGPAATQPVVYGGHHDSSPTPTFRAAITHAVDVLNDPNLSADVAVNTQLQVASDVSNTGSAISLNIKFGGSVSQGDQQGVWTVGKSSQEFRWVNGKIFVRVPPAGKWTQYDTVRAYLVICPVFGITTTKALVQVEEADHNGQWALHLRSTSWWTPDISRMAMYDVSKFIVQPNMSVVDLWVLDDGTPLDATFSATNTAADGRKLIDIQTTYAFSNVGASQDILAPI